jgi:5-hydroxyisourate hydrolase
MSAITTHVLDTARGQPAAGVPVVLEQHAEGASWRLVGRGVTDTDGRLRTLLSEGVPLSAGAYRLLFDTRRYFAAAGIRTFYPEVIVVFEVLGDEAHYHVPLLLSPFGYTTYRGS